MNPNDATQHAIECLTLWMEPGIEARQKAAEHIADLLEAGLSAHALIAGLLNLNMVSLGLVAKELGASTAEEIRTRQTEALSELALWVARGGPK